MSVDHYTFRVTWSPEDGEHVGLAPNSRPCRGWQARLSPHQREFDDLWPKRLPICKPLANRFRRRLRRSITVASFGYAFRPKCIAPLPSRRQNKA